MNEPICGEESDRTCHQEKEEDKDSGVAKIENGGNRSCYGQLGFEKMHAVYEQIDCGETGSQEWTGPPVIIFRTKMEVGKKDGGFGTCYNKNKENDKQEAEHVEHFMCPYAIEDEK